MRVLILGCGPAGLIAAAAASYMNADVAILSKARKSHMKGAQYLHRPIPNFTTGDPFEVTYTMRGNPGDYRFKVYGRLWDGTVSPEDLAESHSAWDIRQTYDRLWDTYKGVIQDWEATPGGFAHLVETNKPDLVISSIPAPLLCHQGHTFRATNIFSSDQHLGNFVESDDNLVICNGEPDPRWYRLARIQGWDTIEWPGGIKPPITPMWEVQKPLTHNCDCFPNVVRVGRYGAWQKGILSHEAYQHTMDAIIATRKRMEQA